MHSTCGYKEADSPHLHGMKRFLKDFVVKQGAFQTSYKGGAVGYKVLTDPEVSIMNMYMAKGEVLPSHKHDSVEVVTVVHGTFKACVNGVKRDVEESETIIFKPGELHGGIALTTLRAICISIPADEGYPGVPRK